MSDTRIAANVERRMRAHRDEFVDDLVSLINIRSVTEYGESGYPMGSGCHEVLERFAQIAHRFGFDVEHDEGYTLSVIKRGLNPQNELGILGHLDVVSEGTGWKYQPFDAIEKNGWIIGRGAADNKGPLLMALYTLCCMQELGIDTTSDIRLIAGCDEECEMRDIRHYLAAHEPPRFTLNCDGAWAVGVGEKGIMTADLVIPLPKGHLVKLEGGDAPNTVPACATAVLHRADRQKLTTLCEACKSLTFEQDGDAFILHAHGKAAHCAAPSTGSNAVRLLLQRLTESDLLETAERQTLSVLLKALADDEGVGLHISYADRLSGRTTCVPALLSLQNGMVKVHLNIRFAVTHQPTILMNRLTQRCEQLGMRLENVRISPPRCDDPKQPEIALLLDTCRELLSRRHQPYVCGGGTYSRIFPRSIPFGAGTPGKPFPNALGGPHAADEAVCIDDLMLASKVYAVALLRLDHFFNRK